MAKTLVDGFLGSLAKYPDRPALFVDGRTYTYAELAQSAADLAAALPPDESGLVGVLASRSLTAYRGVLAALLSGHGYVPLTFGPATRNVARMLRVAGTRTWIVGAEYVPRLGELLAEVPYPLRLILPDTEDIAGGAPIAPRPARGERLAYVMFTSGSTGEPKGIWVSQDNVRAYLDWAQGEYGFTADDRFSQTFDLTFDPSVHDLFCAWGSGASVHCLPRSALITPLAFVRDRALTCWYSVPSVVTGLLQLHALKPGCLPSLRLSLFVGEQLLVDWARAWKAAAPNARIDNVYGPTETTVTITAHTFDESADRGVVPIGRVIPGQRGEILDESGRAVAPGTPGELYLAGTQVTLGYRNDPARDRERFVERNGERWYRTGDLVRADASGCLTFLGRVDNQVKVRGHRVDLGELDALIGRVTGCVRAVTVAWPLEYANAPFVYAFLCGAGNFDETTLLTALRAELPPYLVPRRLFAVDELPLNANGKVDRPRLTQDLARRMGEDR